MLSTLTESYKYKMKTADELAVLVGDMPRQKKVIMCHGVFDVVHPGHLRHLLYAKSKADILIASVTADRHITKGQNRPHVPQDLRALSLAAFDFVDYVLVDHNATPIENLKKIKPNFFAKGYEYTAGGLPPKTQEEVDVLRSFGGEVIFTPGDIVYSSSRLIDLAPPEIKLEKLLNYMDKQGLTFEALRGALGLFSKLRVHVVGDTIVDSYTHAAMIGGQTKTPTMSVLYERRDDYIGGAAVVAEHLRAAGAQVKFSTVLGDDAFKQFVLDGMARSGVECDAIIDSTRPTTNKNAIVTNGYRLLKIDTLDNRSISDDIVTRLQHSIAEGQKDAIVFSDFRHGIFNRRTIPQLIASIPQGVYKVADSQVASRWGNITDFKGFDLITPNEREARFALGDQDSGVRPLASALYDAAACKTLMLKLGERGVLTYNDSNHQSAESYNAVDSFVDRVVDAVGAGDALLAYATLARCATGSDAIATILGSIAAACECEVDGNVPITPQNVLAKIATVERQVGYVGQKAQGDD